MITSRKKQKGFLLLTVVVSLFLIATIAILLNNVSATSANTSNSELEAARAEYVAQAGLQHAMWRAQNNACLGDVTISATTLGLDSYSASVTGAAAGTLYSLSADQDAWIRSDDVTTNNGTSADQHVKFENGGIEHALTRFDLAALPSNAQINTAIAWFYVATGGPGGGVHPEGPLTVHRVTADWTETGATWDTMGGQFEPYFVASVPAQPQSGVWVSINLTGQVQSWVNGQPNYGILLAATAEGVHGKYVSREGGANAPRLEVVVGSGTASPVSVEATGALVNGVTRTLKQPVVPAVQPPAVLILQPDATDGTDAYIWEANKTTNYGADDETWVSLGTNNTSRALFKFNLGAVPSPPRIVSARLSLYHESGNDPDVPVTAHRITQPWDEDFVTWNNRDKFDSWKTAGADFDPGVVSTTDVGPTSKIRYEWDITSLVQDWIDGAPNYGVALATPLNGAFGERFNTSDHADPTRRPILTITFACECGAACMSPQGKGKVLMVIGDWPGNPAAVDRDIRSYFESWGYIVNLIQDDDSQGNFNTALATNDVVYISDTVSSNNIGLKLTPATIGIVSQKGNHNLELEIASGQAQVVGTTVNVTDPSHYITQPFAGTALPIYSADMEMITMPATVAAGVQTLTDSAGIGGLVVMETGSTDLSGNPIAGRRVVLPLGRDGNFNWNYLNGNGRLLVQRALAWGAGDGAKSLGPFAHWKLDDGAGPIAVDIEGGHDGTLTDGPVWVAGQLGDALNFDGVNDYVDAGTFDVQGSGLTMMGWFNAETIPETDPRIISKASGPNPSDPYWQLSTRSPGSDRYMRMRIKAGGTTSELGDSSVLLTTAQWYFAVGTYDAATGEMKLYLDGVEIASGTHSVGGTVDAGPTVPVAIGANGTAERFFDGILDDVRVYDRALSATEIADLYADGLGGPIAHWKLDDGTGLTAIDSVGGHDGTLTNGPVWVGGQLADALSFPGNDDYVNVPHNDALSLTDMTISLWLKATALNNVYQTMLRKKQQANYQLTTWDDEIVFAFNDGSGMKVFQTTNANLTTNQWYHVAATLDDTTGDINIYVDGTSIYNTTTPYHPLPNTEPLTIGGTPDASTYWPGMLDDIRLYDYPMSATEISDLFTAGSGGGGGGGGPAPVFESFEEYRDADNNSSAISVAKPAGTAAGDLLVAVVVTNRNNEATLVADDAGWNLLTVDRQFSSSTTGVWWKLAGSSEPSSYGFSWDAANPGRSYSWIMRFSGNDPTSPINVWDKLGTGGSATPPSPAVTTTVDDTLILRIGGFDDDDITVGDPGMAGHTPITMQESNSGTGTVSGGAAYVEQAASGNSGTSNFTLTASEQSRTITIGIAPAPE